MRAAIASYELRKTFTRSMRAKAVRLARAQAVNLEKCRRFVRRVKRDRSLKRARVMTAT